MTTTIRLIGIILIVALAGTQGVAQVASSMFESQLSPFGKTLPDTARLNPSLELRRELMWTPLANSQGIHIAPQHRALFCRFDDDLDRNKIPLRLRLGSLDEVNRMEGKPGWRAEQVIGQ